MRDYHKRFWDYDRSPYIADKLSLGIRLGNAYARCGFERVVLYWTPCFQGKRPGELWSDFYGRLYGLFCHGVYFITAAIFQKLKFWNRLIWQKNT
jgi:hypothetical protein